MGKGLQINDHWHSSGYGININYYTKMYCIALLCPQSIRFHLQNLNKITFVFLGFHTCTFMIIFNQL